MHSNPVSTSPSNHARLSLMCNPVITLKYDLHAGTTLSLTQWASAKLGSLPRETVASTMKMMKCIKRRLLDTSLQEVSGDTVGQLLPFLETRIRLVRDGDGFSLAVLLLATVVLTSDARGQPLPSDSLWQSNAPWCAADSGGKNSKLVLDCVAGPKDTFQSTAKPAYATCFPSKGSEEPTQPCDDGDMTLFNGLICSADTTAGCDAVSGSQDPDSGRWYRSPRLRLIGPGVTTNSFSPDMAVGVYHWLVSRPSPENKASFERWLDWLAKNKRCLNADCSRKWPRFCPDDDDAQPGAEYGCTMRPGDLATLGVVTAALGIPVRDPQIRALSEKWKESAVTLAWISAHTNEVGYRLHLAASVLYLYSRLGVVDPALTDAIASLKERQPKNPFFNYLAGDITSAKSLTFQLCPATRDSVAPIGQRFQWSWERADSEEAWKKSMLWDCLFISKKLK